MKKGSVGTSAAGGFIPFIISKCGFWVLAFAAPAMAAVIETSSFSPVFVKDETGKPQTLTWTYMVNGGNSMAVEDDDLGDMTIKCGDLKVTVNPLAKTRESSLPVSISGDTKGSATAKFTESLEDLGDSVNVGNQQVGIGMNLSEEGLKVSVSVQMLTQFSPGLEWFLDRSDLDQLGVGYERNNETQGATTGSVKVSIPVLNVVVPVYKSDIKKLDYSGSVPDRWVIVDVLDRFQVGWVEYRDVAVVERTTQVPKGDTGGTMEETVMTYWVAKGVGMVKGVGQYQFMGQPLEIELKSATLVPSAQTDLPAWAQGTFNGYVVGGGVATMSVTAQGSVTGKLALGGTNYAFSAASYAAGGSATNGFSLTADAKAGKASLPLELRVTRAANAPSQALGVCEGDLGGVWPAVLYRSVWKDADMGAAAADYAGYYTAALPGGAAYGSGYLALTVDGAGGVKAAGKLADGTAVSLSGPLILGATGSVFTVLYTAPAAYKGGCLSGLAEFAEPTGGGNAFLRPLDGALFLWESRSPQATEEYGKGFSRETGLSGGWYDKAGNLYGYYRNRRLAAGTDAAAPAPEIAAAGGASAWWRPDGVALTVATNKLGAMTGLAAPKAGLPVKAAGAYSYAAPNAVGLTVSLTRATGVFKGAFKAWFDYGTAHTPKSLSYEGVLTPEREDKADGAEGRGFFLWADKTVPPAPAKPYAFNWSYDFKILFAE